MLLLKSNNPAPSSVTLSRSFDPRQLPSKLLSSDYFLFREVTIPNLPHAAIFRLTFDGSICDSLQGPLRAALREPVPKHRGMHLTTSRLSVFEELSIVSKLKGDEHLLRIIVKLRNADGGGVIVVSEDNIESIQYVKPLCLNDVVLPDVFSIAFMRYICGSAYIHQSDDHIFCSNKNRIVNRIRFWIFRTSLY